MKEDRSTLLPANLNIAKFDTDKLTARNTLEIQKNHITFIFAPSKELSDYAEHIKPGDEEFFENTKKEQLSAALAKNMQRPPMPYRLDALSMLIVLLAPTVHHSDPPTEAQIYFWAMLEAFREYMKTKGPYFDAEILQQLTMDMTFAFYRLLVEGMDIAVETKLQLQKAMDEIASKEKIIDAWEMVNRDLLNVKHPCRPALTIQDAADACGVAAKTISRWEKYRRGENGGTKPPEWYPGLNVDIIRLRALSKEERERKRLARAMRKSEKNASRYIEGRDRPANDDE